MKVRFTAATAATAAAAALAAPGGASAATLAVQGACFVTNAPVPVVGAQWQPGSVVSIGGDAFGSAQADGAGNIAAQVQAPFVSTIAPKVVTVTATIPSAPSFTASARFPVIRDVLLSNAPLSGRPRQKTTWHFTGFPGGVAIYGHYRFRGRTIKNYRFGRPTGPCGTLTVRARRVPVPSSRLRSGTWTLQLDQRRHYRRSGARRVIRFRIFRTLL
jgi:hypothetical protein